MLHIIQLHIIFETLLHANSNSSVSVPCTHCRQARSGLGSAMSIYHIVDTNEFCQNALNIYMHIAHLPVFFYNSCRIIPTRFCSICWTALKCKKMFSPAKCKNTKNTNKIFKFYTWIKLATKFAACKWSWCWHGDASTKPGKMPCHVVYCSLHPYMFACQYRF